VPATPVRHLLRRGDEHDAEVVAGKRADRARSMFKRRGVHLAGTRVGAASPADAVDDELRDNPGYAGVVISTLPKEKSRWLRMDLPRAVESRHNLRCITCRRRRSGRWATCPDRFSRAGPPRSARARGVRPAPRTR
jgi:hypothetical protein